MVCVAWMLVFGSSPNLLTFTQQPHRHTHAPNSHIQAHPPNHSSNSQHLPTHPPRSPTSLAERTRATQSDSESTLSSPYIPLTHPLTHYPFIHPHLPAPTHPINPSDTQHSHPHTHTQIPHVPWGARSGHPKRQRVHLILPVRGTGLAISQLCQDG